MESQLQRVTSSSSLPVKHLGALHCAEEQCEPQGSGCSDQGSGSLSVATEQRGCTACPRCEQHRNRLAEMYEQCSSHKNKMSQLESSRSSLAEQVRTYEAQLESYRKQVEELQKQVCSRRDLQSNWKLGTVQLCFREPTNLQRT